MAVIDKLKTFFLTEWGVYYYLVMPFGLKKFGATYQRIAQDPLSKLFSIGCSCFKHLSAILGGSYMFQRKKNKENHGRKVIRDFEENLGVL